ncbi:MAG: prepilin-type N-terminal cleavage/methylation domain-containing protein [Polaromonas sp.]
MEEQAPTLATACAALPPGGALHLRPGKAGSAAPAGVEEQAPTLVASRTALPPKGALRLRPGKAGSAAPAGGFGDELARVVMAPTLVASRAALRAKSHFHGFTLIELLVVVAIMAVATAGVSLSLRDTSGTALEREAQRLAVLLESARAQSRMSAIPVRWRSTATGFAFDGLANSSLPTQWLSPDVQAAGMPVVTLGPEPVIGPQQITLVSISKPENSLTLASDGVRPFSVKAEPPARSGSP